MIFLDENNCLCAHVGRVPITVREEIRRRRMNQRMLAIGVTKFVGVPGGVAFYEHADGKANLVAGANLADLKPKLLLSFHSSETLGELIAVLDQERSRLRAAGQ